MEPRKPRADKAICLAAEKQDKDAIESILSNGVGIHVSFGIDGTPVAQLARQNKTDAVNFLISQYDVSPFEAAFGYALGGHIESANKLLAAISNPTERCKMMGQMVAGYICRQKPECRAEVLKLKGQVKGNPEQEFYIRKLQAQALTFVNELDEGNFTKRLNEAVGAQGFELLMDAMMGYARAGNVEACKKILEKTKKMNEQRDLFFEMIFSLMKYGYASEVESIFSCEKNPIIKMVILNAQAIGYCAIGNVEAAINAYNKLEDEQAKENALERMVSSLVCNGHISNALMIVQKAKPALKNHLSLTIASALARIGFNPDRIRLILGNGKVFNEIRERKGEPLLEVAFSYAINGHITQANHLLDANEPIRNTLKKTLIRGYVRRNWYQEAERFADSEGMITFIGELIAKRRGDLVCAALKDKSYEEKDAILYKVDRKYVSGISMDEYPLVLSGIQDFHTRYLVADKLSRARSKAPNREVLLIRAKNVCEIKQTYNCTDKQAVAWSRGDIQWLFLEGWKYCHENLDFMFLIANFLYPIQPYERNFFQNAKFNIVQMRPLRNKLQTYYDSTGEQSIFGKFFQGAKARKLLDDLQGVTSEKVLCERLQAELKQSGEAKRAPEEKDPFIRIVKEEVQRLTRSVKYR